MLTCAVSSSAQQVATARAAGARVTLTAVGFGRATITVTATDPGGLSEVRFPGSRRWVESARIIPTRMRAIVEWS